MKTTDFDRTIKETFSFNQWRFLYHYAMRALEQDIERFHKLDDKISKFITIVTIVISVFIAVVSFILKNHFPPKHPLEWLLIILIFFTFISLCSLWSFLFRGLRLQDVPRMPFNNDTINFFMSKHGENTIYFALTRTCLKAFEKNKEINSKKVHNLNMAYNDTVYAASLIVADLLILSVLQF